MIKSYSHVSSRSYSVDFIYQAAKKRRKIAYDNAIWVQQELGIAPTLAVVK